MSCDLCCVSLVELDPAQAMTMSSNTELILGVIKSVASNTSGGKMFNVMVLLRAVFFCSYLTSSALIKDAIREALLTVLPMSIQSSVQGVLTGNLLVPSKSTISRALLSLEIAMMMHTRTHIRDVCRFGWADSSEKGGYDLLLSAHDEVFRCNLVGLFRAARSLCQHRKDSEQGREVDEADSTRNLTVLFDGITRRNDIPVALGKGCTKLHHKCSALVHKWWFLSGSEPFLLQHRQSYMSFCTDLGTEVSTGDFRVESIRALLPPWALQEPVPAMEPDVAMDEAPGLFEDDVAVEDDGLEGAHLEDACSCE